MSERCNQAADVLCKFFPHRSRITFSSSKIATRSHVSLADLIGAAICRGGLRVRVKIAAACARRLVNHRVAYQPSLARSGTRPTHCRPCLGIRACAAFGVRYDDASRHGPSRLGPSRRGQCDLGHSLQPGSRLSSADLHASIPRDYASVIGDQAFWRF
jgi:hypothetical protein